MNENMNNSKKIVYLDNAATTNVLPEVIDAAVQSMRDDWYNPSSRYPQAVTANKKLSADRKIIADALGCKPNELVFTSCGTESDNWALRVGAYLNRRKGKHIITSAIEHSAILETCHSLERDGYEVDYLKPNAEGKIELQDLKDKLRPDTAVVSIMLVNNELGTVQPIKEACQLVKAYDKKILFHTDAVQGFLKVNFNVKALNIDLLSISGHKVHAPKGIGALYIRSGLRFLPFITGGGQENNLRSGTEPTAQIAAFAKAVSISKTSMSNDIVHMQKLKEYTIVKLSEQVPEVKVICSGDAPHILALTLKDYKAEVLVRVLGDNGVCVSSGSACHRGKPSHVYASLNLTKGERDGAFRVSFDRSTSYEDVDYFVEQLLKAKNMLFTTLS